MSREIDEHNHHLNGSLPSDIPEDLREFLQEVEGLSFEEAILQQASVYQSYQESVRNRVVATDDDHISESCSSDDDDDDGECSMHEDVISQEAIDEAIARSLQDEFDELYLELYLTESSDRASDLTESPMLSVQMYQTEVASPDSSQQEDIDPDNMRYEELLNLGETVGVENIGLSADRLSRLPNSIYTSGMFSRNKEEKTALFVKRRWYKPFEARKELA
ncbi:hypothetical protein L2E82_31728 [Cichorium intybus]|uniref:Uncharacterized protein n=1 Tax=Cichorium intybus TaxID=13427 RepID=A0ACB9BFJ5_CICIN|nr:hypothetical protein L2E82_31728 [Cichorium intybus]